MITATRTPARHIDLTDTETIDTLAVCQIGDCDQPAAALVGFPGARYTDRDRGTWVLLCAAHWTYVAERLVKP